MKKYRKLLFMLLCSMCMLIVVGCQSEPVKFVVGGAETTSEDSTAKDIEEKIYKKASDTYDKTFELYGPNGTENGKGDQSIGEYLISWLMKTYSALKEAAPYIGVCSFVCGFMLFLFARGNKRIRKHGLFTLMIGVPCLLIVLVYGVGYLKKMIG